MEDQSSVQLLASSPDLASRQSFWRRLRSPFGALLSVSVMTALVAALVAGILVFASLRRPSGVALSAQPAPPAPPHWRIYHAPDNAFSVAVPDSWTAQIEHDTATMGDRTGSDTVTETFISLSGRNTISVSIYMSPIHDAFEHHWYCGADTIQQTNTMVAGLPAMYDPAFGWLLDTSAAHFQINYEYPGYTGDVMMTSAPTPIPTAEYAEGQREINAIIASFRPNPDAPLKC